MYRKQIKYRVEHQKRAFLDGPVSMYEYKSKPESGLNRHFYFVGDWHRDFDLCQDKISLNHYITFPQLLNDALVLNPHKTIDCLFENSYYTQAYDESFHKSYYPNARNVVLSTMKVLGADLDCYKPLQIKSGSREPCKYPNLRFHKIDLRDMIEDEYPVYKQYTRDVDEFDELIEEEQEKIVEKYTNRAFLDTLDSNFEQILKKFKIERQILAANVAGISNMIFEYGRDTHAALSHNSRALLAQAASKRDAFDSIIYDYYININALAMDLYILGRLFRKFKDGTEINNAIIVTGNFHTQKYINFIERTGMFDRIFAEDARPKVIDGVKGFDQCLNISKLHMPLFS